MPRFPLVHLTDTTLVVVAPRRLWAEHRTAHQALLDWCTDHGLDPHAIPADGLIRRDSDARTIVYPSVVRSGEGAMILDEKRDPQVWQVTKHLDQPPAPWPTEIVALSEAFGGREDDIEAAKADERERIAQALEAEAVRTRMYGPARPAFELAARIARAVPTAPRTEAVSDVAASEEGSA